MNFPRGRAALLASLFGILLIPSASTAAEPSIWTPVIKQKIVTEALKVAPPSLARLIIRHSDSLMAGLADAEANGISPQHRQEGLSTAGSAASSLALTAKWAAAAMDGHKPMATMVYRMGVVAHYALDLSDPMHTAPGSGQAQFIGDYSFYVERNSSKFPVVFYGYPEPAGPAGDPSSILESPTDLDLHQVGLLAAQESRVYYSHLVRAYATSNGASRGFDVRSIPFGVASICYSRAVTNVARGWLFAWRVARGDISGTPFLKGAPALPKSFRIKSRPDRRQRPVLTTRPTYPAPKRLKASPAAAAVSSAPADPANIKKTIYGNARSGRPPTGKGAAEGKNKDQERDD
jgi:hypothetical protein